MSYKSKNWLKLNEQYYSRNKKFSLLVQKNLLCYFLISVFLFIFSCYDFGYEMHILVSVSLLYFPVISICFYAMERQYYINYLRKK